MHLTKYRDIKINEYSSENIIILMAFGFLCALVGLCVHVYIQFNIL